MSRSHCSIAWVEWTSWNLKIMICRYLQDTAAIASSIPDNNLQKYTLVKCFNAIKSEGSEHFAHCLSLGRQTWSRPHCLCSRSVFIDWVAGSEFDIWVAGEILDESMNRVVRSCLELVFGSGNLRNQKGPPETDTPQSMFRWTETISFM